MERKIDASHVEWVPFVKQVTCQRLDRVDGILLAYQTARIANRGAIEGIKSGYVLDRSRQGGMCAQFDDHVHIAGLVWSRKAHVCERFHKEYWLCKTPYPIVGSTNLFHV